MKHERFVKGNRIFIPVGCGKFVEKFHSILHDCWNILHEEDTNSSAIASMLDADSAPDCQVVMVCCVIDNDKKLTHAVFKDLNKVIEKHFDIISDLEGDETIH